MVKFKAMKRLGISVIVLATLLFIFINQVEAIGEHLTSTPAYLNSELSTKYIPTIESSPDMGDFISDALAFQTAILVLFIPLSMDVIARISDRYKSEIILRRFQREPVLKLLVPTLFINIVYILFLKYFNTSEAIFSQITLTLELISLFLLAMYIKCLLNYTRISYIKEHIISEVKSILQ